MNRYGSSGSNGTSCRARKNNIVEAVCLLQRALCMIKDEMDDIARLAV